MEAIIVAVSLVGWKISKIDFFTLYTYLTIAFNLYRLEESLILMMKLLCS